MLRCAEAAATVPVVEIFTGTFNEFHSAVIIQS